MVPMLSIFQMRRVLRAVDHGLEKGDRVLRVDADAAQQEQGAHAEALGLLDHLLGHGVINRVPGESVDPGAPDVFQVFVVHDLGG